MDDETKLTLHGLQQHYVKLQDREKNRKLFDLLDALEFNQVGVQGSCLHLKLCTLTLQLHTNLRSSSLSRASNDALH